MAIVITFWNVMKTLLNTIFVCRRNVPRTTSIGLADEIINAAKEQISKEDESFEDVIADLEQSRVTIEKEQQEITARLNQFEKEMSFNYIPGVVAFMEDLRAHGVKIAIVTSSNDLKMANVYKAHPELKELVDRILTAEMFTRSKPAPDCFLLGAEVFDTVVENCVVFEDSFHGLEAGNAANMAVVGLCTTNSAEAIADKCKLVIPDFTAFSFEKMKALLA